jgi:hypothetical protein
VRALHKWGDYIFSGGKGTSTAGSLLIWDFRNLNPLQAMEEKERCQDILSFVNNILLRLHQPILSTMEHEIIV